ncbi:MULTISPECIES: RNA polymerase sigma factor [Chryseobacterium]|uniref:RNA polymerase sigma factor n=1 Tax=Chryseobacterium sp. R2A-55 TaxID=2744445 RepID=UPI001F20AAFD|nr:sigma-70 family RNA polymerase sigma factor [Chryseobacterium sp. R2A-55]
MDLTENVWNDHLKLTDEETIQEILAGNLHVFEILIRRYNPFLYKIGKSYHFSQQDVEDLMQDCYLNIYKNLAKFEERSTFKTWIAKIMLHLCYQKKQNFKRLKNTISEEKTYLKAKRNQSFSQDGALVHKELGIIIETAIQGIPINLRNVFVLREINGLNTQETANLLQITESNVKVRLSRAKQMLRQKIGENYLPEELVDFHDACCSLPVEMIMQKTVRGANNE